MIQTIEDLLVQSPVFKGFDPQFTHVLAGCASNVRFNAGDHIFREGDESSRFYILRAGKVALEISAPGRGPLIIQTVQEGDVLGWSSMVPPVKKHFDARAIELTRAFAFDGECVRKKCDEDPKLGYELLKLFASVIGQRLQATRVQLLDLYGANS